jgi:hypothetical protein
VTTQPHDPDSRYTVTPRLQGPQRRRSALLEQDTLHQNKAAESEKRHIQGGPAKGSARRRRSWAGAGAAQLPHRWWRSVNNLTG